MKFNESSRANHDMQSGVRNGGMSGRKGEGRNPGKRIEFEPGTLFQSPLKVVTPSPAEHR